MPNADKIILDLCGGTGAWSKPYKDNDYTVINVTLPEYDVRTYIPPDNVYGILAAPPCTMFSLQRTNQAKIARDLDGAMEIVKACLNIIWKCKPEFWVLENPLGILRRFLGRPYFTFQPYEYGDRYSKKTDLWGYFNIPPKNPLSLEQQEIEYQNKSHMHKFPSAKEYPGISRADRRAITPAGFALAFYKANK